MPFLKRRSSIFRTVRAKQLVPKNSENNGGDDGDGGDDGVRYGGDDYGGARLGGVDDGGYLALTTMVARLFATGTVAERDLRMQMMAGIPGDGGDGLGVRDG